jgi:hypothetical protein
LKNKAIVDEAEKLLKDFRPVTYDANAHVNAIESFEEKAVSITMTSAPFLPRSRFTRPNKL